MVRRIPASLLDTYEVDVLIIDDSSRDATFDKGPSDQQRRIASLPRDRLFNPVNQGYGGNQKIGYRYAIENGYDFVALIHGDGQYAPDACPNFSSPCARARPRRSSARAC